MYGRYKYAGAACRSRLVNAKDCNRVTVQYYLRCESSLSVMNHEVLSALPLFWAFMLARDPVRAALVLVLSALPVAFAAKAKGGGGGGGGT